MNSLSRFLKLNSKPHFKRGKRSAARSLQLGFTIAELMVVVTIFAIITSVALLDQNRLDSDTLITNLAYETALSIHEAQVYGVGVRNFTAGGTDDFNGVYGVYFNMSSPTQIVLYNDKNDDTVNDPGDALYEYSFTNQRGNAIKALCLGDLGGQPCTVNSPVSVTSLRVIFKRPSLEAQFYPDDSGTGISAGPAYIVVDNVDNSDCRVVIVEPTGQIRVESATDPSHACQ